MAFALKVAFVVKAFIGITRAVRVTPEFSVDGVQKPKSEPVTQDFSQVIAKEESEPRAKSQLVLQNIPEEEVNQHDSLSSSLQETNESESGFEPQRHGGMQRASSSNAIPGMSGSMGPTAMQRANTMQHLGRTKAQSQKVRSRFQAGAKKAVAASRLGNIAGLSGNEVYSALKPSTPYSYARFKTQYDRNAGKLLTKLQAAVNIGSIRSDDNLVVAISKVRQFRACDSLMHLSSDTETKGMFNDRWDVFRQAWPKPTEAINRALIAEQKVNRVHVMENEIETGKYFRTMNIIAQTFVLGVLLPSVDVLIKQLGRRQPKIMFAGCGLGDWAVEALLEFGNQADVTCYNYNYATMTDGANLIRDKSVAFDSNLNPALVSHVQQNLHYSCSEHGFKGKGCLDHAGFFTFQIDQLATVMRTTFDVVIYGNALTPQEAEVVRRTLTDAHSFAIIPVCTKRKQPAQHGQGANCYCEGVYYKISMGGYQGPIFPFGHVMRPWGTEGGGQNAAGVMEPPCTEAHYDHSSLARATNGMLERVPSIKAEISKPGHTQG